MSQQGDEPIGKGEYEFMFDCNISHRPNEDPHLVDAVVTCGAVVNNLGAVGCANENSASNYFDRHGVLRSCYSPMIGYKHNEGVLLIGQELHISLEEWTKQQKQNLWILAHGSPVRASEILQAVARPILIRMYKQHLLYKCVGNLLSGTRVDPRTNSVIFLEDASNKFSLIDGIIQDLEDLRKFATWIAPGQSPSDLLLYEAMFPKPEEFPRDVEKLLQYSYVLSHAPLWMQFNDRYNFLRNFLLVNKNKEHSRIIHKHVRLDHGISDVGDWWNTVQACQHQILLDTYRYNRLTDKFGIIFYIRATFDHYIKHNALGSAQPQAQAVVNMTLEDIDNILLEVIPDAFPKLYYEVFHPEVLKAKGCMIFLFRDSTSYPLDFTRA